MAPASSTTAAASFVPPTSNARTDRAIDDTCGCMLRAPRKRRGDTGEADMSDGRPTISALTRRDLLKTGAAVGGAVAIAPLIAACTPSATNTGGGSGGPAGAQTIRVWGFGLDDTRAKERLGVFTKANPNITVQNAGGGLSRQQVLTAVVSGDPPEVIRIGNRGETPAWAARSAIQELDDLVARDKFNLSDF